MIVVPLWIGISGCWRKWRKDYVYLTDFETIAKTG